MPPQNKHNRLLWKETQNVRYIDILRDHGVQSTLMQSSETSRTMFVAVFNDIGDIHMINSVCRKHKYHQILQRRALMSGKRLCGKWFINTFLTRVNCT